jgi:hypothetical protein
MKNKVQKISRRTIVLLSFFCILLFVSLNIKAKNTKEKFLVQIDIIYEQSIQENFDYDKIVDKGNRYINWDIFYYKFKKDLKSNILRKFSEKDNGYKLIISDESNFIFSFIEEQQNTEASEIKNHRISQETVMEFNKIIINECKQAKKKVLSKMSLSNYFEMGLETKNKKIFELFEKINCDKYYIKNKKENISAIKLNYITANIMALSISLLLICAFFAIKEILFLYKKK